ncbi:hypothetical protein B566_EDAN013854 [Ephemera danica]|nr:hypothetical protein B566_EDAN013854 [Ephemera danica]
MAANAVLSWLDEGDPRDVIVHKATQMCVHYQVQEPAVCFGIAEAYVVSFSLSPLQDEPLNDEHFQDTVMFIYKARKQAEMPLSSEDFCYLAMYPDGPYPGNFYEWSLNLKFLDTPPPRRSNALCKELSCCRREQGPPTEEGGGAGYWGDYRDCDSPPHAFTNLVQQAAASHPNLEYVMYTGDSVSHAGWACSVEENTQVMRYVLRELQAAFPDKLILPLLGNHEAHPGHSFPPQLNGTEEATFSWLYDETLREWTKLLSAQGAKVYKGGFYSIAVKPGLLVLAEKRGQKVHILAHVPGNDRGCVRHWRREYQRVLRRFQDTVIAQFHGHTHTDFYSLYYDSEDDTQVTGVAFTTGSATPYVDINPSYKVFTIEAERHFRVLDFETWYFNLTEANLAGSAVPPNWQKLYSFNEAYGTTFTLPDELDNLATRLAADPELLQKYFRHHVSLGDRSLANMCDPECRIRLLGDIVSYDPDNTTKLKNLLVKGGGVAGHGSSSHFPGVLLTMPQTVTLAAMRCTRASSSSGNMDVVPYASLNEYSFCQLGGTAEPARFASVRLKYQDSASSTR